MPLFLGDLVQVTDEGQSRWPWWIVFWPATNLGQRMAETRIIRAAKVRLLAPWKGMVLISFDSISGFRAVEVDRKDLNSQYA
jgi:hypothetical protein